MELSPKEYAALDSIGLEGCRLGTIDTPEKFAIALLLADVRARGYVDTVIEPGGATHYLTTKGAMVLEAERA